jgi:hypothetical protein
MDIQDENKNTANESIGPDFDQSKGMMGMKGNQLSGQTYFQPHGKVSSDNPEPGTHHGVFPTPGQENVRQFGEHHYDIQGGRPKDLYKDVDGVQPVQQHGQQFDNQHNLPSGGHQGELHGQDGLNGVGDDPLRSHQRSGMHDVTEELRTRAERGEFEMKEGKNWMASKEQSGV